MATSSVRSEHLHQRLKSAVFEAFRLQPVLHLVDIENLIPYGQVNNDHLRRALTRYLDLLEVAHHDTVIVAIAARHHRALAATSQDAQRARPDTPGPHLVLGHDSKNGADDALIGALNLLELRSQPLHEDFREVVFASGDARFVPSAKRLKENGLVVVNVSADATRSGAWTAKVDVDLRDF